MSLSSYIFRKFLSNPSEALRIKRAGDEIRNYAAWKLYSVLEEYGLVRLLQEQSWWEFRDKDLAKLVSDILVEEGIATRVGDRVRIVSKPEKPRITTQEAADIIPVFDYALRALPRALESGEKPSLSDVKPIYAKLLGNFAVKLEIEAAIDTAGIGKLGENAVIADIYPRIGVSTLALLEMTKSKIIVVEPYASNIDVIRGVVKISGGEERVTFIQSPLEEMKLPEKADAIFMAEVIHWVINPRLVMMRAGESLKPGGLLVIAQSLYSSAGLVSALPGYILGALALPPTSDQLSQMIKGAGFKIAKWLESLGVAIIVASLS